MCYRSIEYSQIVTKEENGLFLPTSAKVFSEHSRTLSEEIDRALQLEQQIDMCVHACSQQAFRLQLRCDMVALSADLQQHLQRVECMFGEKEVLSCQSCPTCLASD